MKKRIESVLSISNDLYPITRKIISECRIDVCNQVRCWEGEALRAKEESVTYFITRLARHYSKRGHEIKWALFWWALLSGGFFLFLTSTTSIYLFLKNIEPTTFPQFLGALLIIFGGLGSFITTCVLIPKSFLKKKKFPVNREVALEIYGLISNHNAAVVALSKFLDLEIAKHSLWDSIPQDFRTIIRSTFEDLKKEKAEIESGVERVSALAELGDMDQHILALMFRSRAEEISEWRERVVEKEHELEARVGLERVLKVES